MWHRQRRRGKRKGGWKRGGGGDSGHVYFSFSFLGDSELSRGEGARRPAVEEPREEERGEGDDGDPCEKREGTWNVCELRAGRDVLNWEVLLLFAIFEFEFLELFALFELFELFEFPSMFERWIAAVLSRMSRVTSFSSAVEYLWL